MISGRKIIKGKNLLPERKLSPLGKLDLTVVSTSFLLVFQEGKNGGEM